MQPTIVFLLFLLSISIQVPSYSMSCIFKSNRSVALGALANIATPPLLDNVLVTKGSLYPESLLLFGIMSSSLSDVSVTHTTSNSVLQPFVERNSLILSDFPRYPLTLL